MAILTLNRETDQKIAYISEKLFETEYLMEEGPKRLEAYGNTLNILKAIKRGIPENDAIRTWYTECCPPGFSTSEECQDTPCHKCWASYLKSIPDKKS